jgi:hypothetical protein
VKFGWRLAALLCVLTWGWVAGCGPRPIDLRVESPQPETPTRMPGTDDVKKLPADRHEGTSANADTVVKPPLIHKVRWGHETLYSISLWYTGNGHFWRRIAAANPKIKPRRMRIGDTIRIPDTLLIRRRPMPEKFLNPAATRKRKKPYDPDQTAPANGPEVQAPPLYGPVGDESPTPVEKHNELPVPLETLDD